MLPSADRPLASALGSPTGEIAVATASLPDHSAKALGLTFANRVGLAAGIDRNGQNLSVLARIGLGHVEVGTITDAAVFAIDRNNVPPDVRVGANFASPRLGVDSAVIDDFVDLLRGLWSQSDYLVANLSAPTAGRTGDTPGVCRLIERLGETRERLGRETAVLKPLLIKVNADAPGSLLPQALRCAPRTGVHGVVLVTPSIERIRECCNELGAVEVISVGGVATAEDVAMRLSAGACLVQSHSLFASEGAIGIQRLLRRPSGQGGGLCIPS